MLTLDEIPIDAWDTTARCLAGADLFALARVNRWSWQLLSQDVYRSDRLSIEDTRSEDGGAVTALQMYMRAYSFQFEGSHKSVDEQYQHHGSCAELSSFDVSVIQQFQPFAFDVWFCLLDESSGAGASDDREDAVYVGGILFGAQSVSYDNHERPDNQLQFAVVSSDRRLFCSGVSKMLEIASELELHRWHHLALTYADQTQRVYLDGQLMSTVVGRVLREWWDVSYAQVGTGYVIADGMRFPEPDCSGWYPFNGLIDNFRLWKRALSSEDVQALARGTTASHACTILADMLAARRSASTQLSLWDASTRSASEDSRRRSADLASANASVPLVKQQTQRSAASLENSRVHTRKASNNPLSECAIYISILFHMPNAKYYQDMQHMTEEKLHKMVMNVLIYAGMELLSLVYVSRMLKRKFGMSVFYQLAFALESDWRIYQSHFIALVLVAFQFLLIHCGCDVSFRFEWVYSD